MNILLIYKSKTGFTEKYSKIIAKQLNCNAINIKKITTEEIAKQDIIIYGSRIHAGIIDGLNKIKELVLKKNKQLIIFATGGTPNKAEDVVEQVWKNNLSEEEIKSIPHFYMQSGICYEKMGKIDSLIMKMASAMMKRKKDKDNNEQGFLQAIDKSYDISSEEYTKPLVNFVENNYNRK